MAATRVRWIVIAGLAAGLAALLAWMFWPRPVEVELAKAVAGPIAEAVSDQGSARVREAYIVAAPVSGRLHRIDLHVGDAVRAGATVVAQIDPAAADLLDPRSRGQAEAAVTSASAAVRAAEAERERLSAEARRAESNLTRIRELAQRGYATRQALDDSEAAARAAKAAVNAAGAEVVARRAEVSRARAALLGPEAEGGQMVTVTAPASGYVTRVLQESARTIPMGAPLVEIADNSGLEAAIEFLSQDAVRIREGMEAEIFDWGGGAAIPALVRRVEPQGFTKTSALGVEEQRVLVLLQLTGPPQAWAKLGPGYRVWGRVFLRREAKVVKAPLGALVRADGGWAVFKIDRGRARLTPVKVGALTDREAEVVSGLKPDDEVVVFPSDRVKDGVQVRSAR